MQYEPFPTEALPSPVRGFVEAGAEAIGCDAAYLALPMLTALAAAIGSARRLVLKRGWSAPAILWTAVVGESGTAKTPAFRMVMRPLRLREQRALRAHAAELAGYRKRLAWYEAELLVWKRDPSRGEAPDKPPEPQAERSIVGDATLEALAPILLANPRGLLLACDELAGWLGSFDRYSGAKGRDEALWLSMHAADSIVVDRKTGDPRTIFVPQAAVCITGGIQPGVLQRALGIERRESGLAARLLLAYPPRTAKRWTDAEIEPAADDAVSRLLERLYALESGLDDEGRLRPVLTKLSSEAKELWKVYYNQHGAEQTELDGELAAAWSKLEEYAARLALVIHFTRFAAGDHSLVSSQEVDCASMAAGIRLANWFKGEARRVYRMLQETPAETGLRRLEEWLERRGGSATARDVRQGCRWLRAPGLAEMVLHELVREGRGVWEAPPPGARGLPTRRFRLSTLSTVNGNRPCARAGA